ncbi:MAG: MBOAT family protein [Lachnospiraceae bacterium]|nr:MBOAT family protein [Lachnospiraceae bacterium]
MVFSDLLFLFRFLPIVLLIYFIAPKKLRNGILFFSSLVFYAWGEPVYVCLMLFSTLVDYVHGRLVYRFKNNGELKKAKIVVASSMIINLGLLGFFKYVDFFIGSVNSVFGNSIEFLNVALPIGISFYTFQTMSYTLDIYMNNEEPQKNIINFGAYVAMFPQLIAGPIVQYRTVANELRSRKENIDDFALGVRRFILGLGKKVLLANSTGAVWTEIKNLPDADLTVAGSWIGIICFALQIYYDFAGYSDMAIGLGKMFGFNFPVNFDYPYLSKSVTEFFRRWHISLGKWFRDYVYIPLGGNRKGLLKQVRNIMIVWFLTGFWHGAAYNFILWGLYFGILLVIEKLFLLKLLNKINGAFAHIYALFVVLIGWVLFEFDSMNAMGRFFSCMFGFGGFSLCNDYTLYLLINSAAVIVIAAVGSTPLPKLIADKILMKINSKEILSAIAENIVLVIVFMICLFYLVAGSYNPFLYFRF